MPVVAPGEMMAVQAADCDSDPATYWDTAECSCKETTN